MDIMKITWKQQHAPQVLSKDAENEWNRLDKKSAKYCKMLWTEKIIQNEEKAIDYIKYYLFYLFKYLKYKNILYLLLICLKTNRDRLVEEQ